MFETSAVTAADELPAHLTTRRLEFGLAGHRESPRGSRKQATKACTLALSLKV
jgi:hypothetical protein